MKDAETELKQDDKHKTVQVSVYTTSGAYPRKGSESVKADERVEKFLKKAQRELHLTDVNGWEATVDGNIIDPNRSYEDNHLSGTVVIHWGPREGGGGC
jgi:maltooligosyltrehalose synthase